MGAKKELRQENLELRQRLEDFEAENEKLRERGGQLARQDVPPVRSGVLGRVAAELGVSGDGADLEGGIIEAIDRIKNPDGDFGDGPQVTKGDSLAQAIEHNAAERKELLRGVTAARAIVQRVAGALGVGQWDADGTEIIEKAQRWAMFAHAIKRRGEQYIKAGLPALASAMRVLLVELVAPKDLAKFVAKLPEVPESVLETAVATSRGDAPALERLITYQDVGYIKTALRDHRTFPTGGVRPMVGLLDLFTELDQSEQATEEFCMMMNLVVLPHLRRLRTPAVE